MTLLEQIAARLDRLERTLERLERRLSADHGPAARVPGPRGVAAVPTKVIEGRRHIWGGEGTGWIVQR